jgi:hypothetical protein
LRALQRINTYTASLPRKLIKLSTFNECGNNGFCYGAIDKSRVTAIFHS